MNSSARPFFFLLAAVFVVLAFPVLAQDVATSSNIPAPPQSIIEIIWHSNFLTKLIWLAIIATSTVMVTLVIQNALSIRNEKLAPRPLFNSLETAIRAGNYQEAWETCNANDNYLANVLRAGLERLGRGKEAVEDSVAEHSLREATIMRTRNSYLSVIGVVSPMIGLLGTVIGMMSAFATLGASGISDPRGLATSIGEVLMATASGLFIAIPAFIAYYIFRNRSQMVIVHADDKVNALLADIPYAELEGVRIGQHFSTGAVAPMPGGHESRRVSMALTTNCPVCNGAIAPGDTPCPHCGTTLQWAG